MTHKTQSGTGRVRVGYGSGTGRVRVGYGSGTDRVRIGIVGIKWGSFVFAYPATGTKMDACGGICNRIGRI